MEGGKRGYRGGGRAWRVIGRGGGETGADVGETFAEVGAILAGRVVDGGSVGFVEVRDVGAKGVEVAADGEGDLY